MRVGIKTFNGIMVFIALLLATAFGMLMYDLNTTIPYLNSYACNNIQEAECSVHCACDWCYFNSNNIHDSCFSINTQLELICQTMGKLKPTSNFCLNIRQQEYRNIFIINVFLSAAVSLLAVSAMCLEISRRNNE